MGGTTPLIMGLYGCQETSTRQDVPPNALQLRLGVGQRVCVFVGRAEPSRARPGLAERTPSHGGDDEVRSKSVGGR